MVRPCASECAEDLSVEPRCRCSALLPGRLAYTACPWLLGSPVQARITRMRRRLLHDGDSSRQRVCSSVMKVRVVRPFMLSSGSVMQTALGV